MHVFHNPTVQQLLLDSGTREEIIGWLVWNDGNGVYTDDDCDSEEMEPLTLELARQQMRDILERDAWPRIFVPPTDRVVDTHEFDQSQFWFGPGNPDP